VAKVAVKWLGEDSRMFVGRDSLGRVNVAGYWPSNEGEGSPEWRGTKASDMLVMALCSCSAYDVVDILQKQRLPLTGLKVTADATQAPEAPWQFTDIHLHYDIYGHDLDANKVERAIKLSEEKYCSVAATIRGVTNLTHSFNICPTE
jgi:putative redox protein